MRFDRLATLVKIIILVAILFSTKTNGLAQSALDLVAHYVEASPAEDGISYAVNIYLSVVDDSGYPIRDLQNEAFTLAEDAQKVEIQNLGVLADEPINLVLVMDTSGSMSGTGITDAKSAAITFISGLKPNDQAAIITFDNNINPRINFTTDRKTITDGINRIDATRDAGTCLYDAAYSAVQMAATLPTGHRAVILFTDGIDETPGGAICSTHTTQDVVNTASNAETRTPIYTIGLGNQINTQTLKFIANQTGGHYLYSSSSSQLANAFQLLSDQLRSQYILTYKSISAPGPHTLTISINQLGAQDSDTRKFSLPALPTRMIFTSPLEGETIGDLLKIAVSLTTQSETIIERVAFEVNGIEAGTDATKPYELELDARQYPVGSMTLSAVAYGANNMELARSSTLNLVRVEALEAPVLAPTEIAPTSAAPAPQEEPNNSMVFMSIVLGGLSIITIGLLIFFLLRQQPQAKAREVESDDDTMPPMQGIPIYRKIDENRKASNSELESDALGALIIEASDDESLIGHRFEITASLVTLGRSADNDINFPNDKPVSRHHAEIYQISGKLYLREVEMADSSGTARPPKYGTFLNQAPMGSDPALLKTGDEILLGKRVRLKFESYTRDVDADALTYDDDDLTATNDIDKTQDQ